MDIPEKTVDVFVSSPRALRLGFAATTSADGVQGDIPWTPWPPL